MLLVEKYRKEAETLRTQLAKANERIAELEKCCKLHTLPPNVVFDMAEAMIPQQLNKFAIENQIKGAYSVISLLDPTKDSKAILMANKYIREQLRKEQE